MSRPEYRGGGAGGRSPPPRARQVGAAQPLVKDTSCSLLIVSCRLSSLRVASDCTGPMPLASQVVITMSDVWPSMLYDSVILTIVALYVPAGTVTEPLPSPWTVKCAVVATFVPFSSSVMCSAEW